jgi:hypothetical protein
VTPVRKSLFFSAGSREEGQATVEVLAAIPILLLTGFVCFQALVTGYSQSLADSAAQAGAIAAIRGQSARAAARSSLPGWAGGRSRISVQGRRVQVRLVPPSPFGVLADLVTVDSSAGWSGRPAAL